MPTHAVRSPLALTARPRCVVHGAAPRDAISDYFRKGRPVLIRGALRLSDRCTLAASDPGMRRASSERLLSCGATAYPELTGRLKCGRYTFLDLRRSPRCTDALRTRPVCNWKLGGVSHVNTSEGFRLMPAALRHAPDRPPMGFLQRAWGVCTSRALWGGTRDSGSGFHYHNGACKSCRARAHRG